jgi:decaprenyl-phosphate phosphoribosyltransferase
MGKTFYYLLKTARPRQWIKNFALFATLVFSGFFFTEFPIYFLTVFQAFVVFCILTSSVYILNDIIDAESDRKHPFKKKRPIASGDLPIPTAVFYAIAGIILVIFLSLSLNPFFFYLVLTYIALQVLYALKLKHIPILDVLTIAAGFIIRVYAGAVVVNLHMNVWFLLTVLSASLFLAIGKRQSERTLLEGELGETRKTLQHYSKRLLDIYTGMFANTTWLTYALYAYQREEFSTTSTFFNQAGFLPRTFTSEKWLMLTIPVVIYIVMRYLQLVYENNQGESPERVLLSDKPLLAGVILWAVSTMFIIYVIGS